MIEKIYNKIADFIFTIIPRYAAIPLILCLTINCAAYWFGRLISQGKYHYDMTTSFDDMIPFQPVWIIIYFGCYLFWVANYILAVRQSKENMVQMIGSDIMGKIICFIFFVALPTTNLRPEVIGHDIFDNLMRFLYSADAADNLFPSIHCLVSWYCCLGIIKTKVPKWYQILSVVIAILIFASTLFTKQHVIVDVIGAVIIAEVTWYAVKFLKRRYLKLR